TWFQTKSEEWAYEKEWRIVRILSEANKRIDTKPFPRCLFDFPPDAVAEIILGLRVSPGLFEQIQGLRTVFTNARVLRMKESPSEYGLFAKEVTVKRAAGR